MSRQEKTARPFLTITTHYTILMAGGPRFPATTRAAQANKAATTPSQAPQAASPPCARQLCPRRPVPSFPANQRPQHRKPSAAPWHVTPPAWAGGPHTRLTRPRPCRGLIPMRPLGTPAGEKHPAQLRAIQAVLTIFAASRLPRPCGDTHSCSTPSSAQRLPRPSPLIGARQQFSCASALLSVLRHGLCCGWKGDTASCGSVGVWHHVLPACFARLADCDRLAHPRPRSPPSIVAPNRLGTSSLPVTPIRKNPMRRRMLFSTMAPWTIAASLLACSQRFTGPSPIMGDGAPPVAIARIEIPCRFAAVRNMDFRRTDDVKVTGIPTQDSQA